MNPEMRRIAEIWDATEKGYKVSAPLAGTAWAICIALDTHSRCAAHSTRVQGCGVSGSGGGAARAGACRGSVAGPAPGSSRDPQRQIPVSE